MKKIVVLFLLLIILFLLRLLSIPPKIYATTLFEDNFDDGDANGWSEVSGTSYLRVENQRYGGIVTPNFTIADSVAGSTTWTDYSYEVDMIAIQGEDKNLLFRYVDSSHRYGFHISYGSLILEKVHPTTIGREDVASEPITFNNNVPYRMRIELRGSHVKIYQNDSLILNYTDNDYPILNGEIGIRVGTGSVAPTEVWYDNIVVTPLGPITPTPTPTCTPTPTETPTPTLTPTPTETPTPTNTPTPTETSTPSPTPIVIIPVIIIPGHGACFNHEGIIHGNQNVPQENWKLLSFLHEYDGLINSIKNSGYALNKDLFVFCYDWRKKVDKTADDLKNFIQNKVIGNRQDISTVKIVGHSLGGLVGRSFAQKYQGEYLEKLVTVGSPHQGVIQSYYPWESGEPYGEKNFEWLTWKLFIQAQKRNFSTNIETVRRLAPSTLDLFPTFNFIKLNDIEEKDFRQMVWKNDWLFDLNNQLPNTNILEKTTSIVGEIGNTPEYFATINNFWFERLIGMWDDGRPLGTGWGMGDLTVLEKSAQIPGNTSEILFLDHGELVRKTDGIRKILNLLGIPETTIQEGDKLQITPSIIFSLGSPASLEVTSPGGQVFNGGEEYFVFISQAQDGNYLVKISPNGPGDYRLFIGRENEQDSSWSEINGNLKNKPITYKVNFNSTSPQTDPIVDENGNLYLEFANQKLLILKRSSLLSQILRLIEETKKLNSKNKPLAAIQNIKLIIKLIFAFRLNSSSPISRNVSAEALDYLATAYKIIANNAQLEINLDDLLQEFADTMTKYDSTYNLLEKLEKLGKLNKNNALSYNLAGQKIVNAINYYFAGKLHELKISLVLAQNYIQESIIIR